MMYTLVGYGVSSDSEEEAEIQSGASKGEENSDQKKSQHNFLLECGSASSSESEDEEEQDLDLRGAPVNIRSSPEAPVPPAGVPACNKLPPPALGRFCVPAVSSVFTNPFKEQAERKLDALQKHVPLTAHARPTHIGGKKVCVGYRKHGRCRFGIRCKFAHDSDLQQREAEPCVPVSDTNIAATHTPACRDSAEDEEENQKKRKKRKVGVSDSLIPPKRALKQYAMQSVSHTHT